MKALWVTIAMLAASPAMATECKKQGGGYMCPGNVYVDGSKASSAAEAAAIAIAKQEQSQGQAQGQSQGQIATGGDAYNGGNTVSISNPKHTTSIGLGVGVNFDIPIGKGYQGASCRDTVRLAYELGWHDVALNVFLECPHVRKLNLKVNPGDKG